MVLHYIPKKLLCLALGFILHIKVVGSALGPVIYTILLGSALGFLLRTKLLHSDFGSLATSYEATRLSSWVSKKMLVSGIH